MDFRDPPDEATFRAEVRAWLRGTLSDPSFTDPSSRSLDPVPSEELRRWWQRTCMTRRHDD